MTKRKNERGNYDERGRRRWMTTREEEKEEEEEEEEVMGDEKGMKYERHASEA